MPNKHPATHVTNRQIPSYTDRSGRAHLTLDDAIRADLAALLGSVAYAAKVFDKRSEVIALLSELPAAKVVAIGSAKGGK